jgi:hypothetical protein
MNPPYRVCRENTESIFLILVQRNVDFTNLFIGVKVAATTARELEAAIIVYFTME